MTGPPVSEPATGTSVSDAIDLAAGNAATRKPGRRRLAGDAVWITIAQVLSVVCALGSLRVWAVYLTPSALGLMALIISFASVLVGVISGPLMQVLVVCFARHQSRGQEHAFRRETTLFLVRCCMAVIGLVLAALAPAAWFLGLNPLLCLAIIPLFAIDSFREYERVMFSCVGRQRMVSLITVLDVWTRLVCVWAMLAFIDATAEVAVLANVVGGGLALLGIISLSRRVASPGRRPADPATGDEIRGEIRAIAYPLVPSAIFVNLTEMSSRYVIAATISLHAAGLFVMAYGLVKRPYGMVRDVGALLMMPLLSRRMVDGSATDVRRVQTLWLSGMLATCIGGGLLFYILRDVISAALMSGDYVRSTIALVPILATGIALFTIASVLDDFLLCERRSRTVLVNRTIAFVASITLLVLLSSTHGLAGAAWSLAGGGIVHLLVASVNVLRGPNKAGTAPISTDD